MATNRELVNRLSKYKNVLSRLRSLGFVRVFSDNLADALSVSPALVRKDFATFGIAGKRRGGYRIDELMEQLNRILGRDRERKVVVVGCGKIGTALMNYRGFAREGIRVVAGFDVNPAKIDPKAPVPVYDMGHLPEVLNREDIRVAIMTVPEPSAAQVLDQVLAAGVRGVLNFAPIMLKPSGDAVVHNINLALEIENLFYFVHFAEKEATVPAP